MSSFNSRNNENFNPNFGIFIVVLFIIFQFSGIYLFSFGSIFPLAILWPLCIWQLNPFKLNTLIILTILSFLQDFTVFDQVGTNLLINLACLIFGYTLRKLTSFVQIGSYIDIIIMSIFYVIISFVYSLLFNQIFDLLSLVIPILLAIFIYPRIYKLFYKIEAV